MRAGTETIAIEVRDRRLPERVLSRDVLARAVDYELEPATGAVFLRRHIGGLDSALNLVQVVVTYEYENTGLENLVFSGRGVGIRGCESAERSSPRRGSRTDASRSPASISSSGCRAAAACGSSCPTATARRTSSRSIDSRRFSATRRADGFAVQATVEQPFAFWDGRASGTLLGADSEFRNPFSSTITPGARYAAGAVELSPREPSRLKFSA